MTGLTFDKAYAVLHLDGGETVVAKCLLIATGADYRRLDVEGCERFEGCGVYYAATPNEAQLCRGAEVVVVGGGNSAGQAAVFLAGQARKVYLLIRGDDLYKNMSSYLARRIEQTANIEVLRNTEVRRMHGDGHLDRRRDRQQQDGRGAEDQDAGGVQLHRRRAADRLAAPGDRERRRGVCPDRPGPGEVAGPRPAGGSRSCWRPAGPACSPPGTCGPARSSASPRPSARGRWRSSSCMST